jgi:hypothetical protein
MGSKLTRRSVILGILLTVFTVAFPSVSQADPLVLRGYDLFATVPPTKVNLGPAGVQEFKGVPLGTFDFGSGPVDTGNADTIVQRLGDASPANPTISIQLVALQFMSVNQFDLGAGTNFHFITLQSDRGGPASMGLMTINFGPEGTPHGTFDSTLSVFFDIRVGALDGPIVFSGSKTLSVIGAPWSHFPSPPGAILIPGVNFLLNGQNQLNDFFAIGRVMHVNPDGSMHTVEAAVPEPATLSLLAAGIAGFAARARAYRRRKAGDSGREQSEK